MLLFFVPTPCKNFSLRPCVLPSLSMGVKNAGLCENLVRKCGKKFRTFRPFLRRRGCDQNWRQFRLAVSTANGSWRFSNCQFCWQLALAVEHWQLAVVRWQLEVEHWQLEVEHWQLALGNYHQKGGDC